MANLLLKDTLNGKVVVEEIISWLTTNDVANSKWDNINQFGCTQSDFLLYFLNFLHDQTKSILQASDNARQTLTKTIQSQVAPNNNTQKTLEKLRRRVSLFNTSENQIPESRNNHVYNVQKLQDVQNLQTRASDNVSTVSKKELSPIVNVDKFEKSVPLADGNAVNDLQVLLNSHNIDDSQKSIVETLKDTPVKKGIGQNLSDHSDISLNTSTSTPIIEKHSANKISKIFNSFKQCDSSKIATNCISIDKSVQVFNSSGATCWSHKESENFIGHIENCKNSNENYDISNCLLISRTDNSPHVIANFSRSELRNSNFVNKSSMFDSSSNDWSHLNNSSMSSRSKNMSLNESHVVNNFMIVNSPRENPISPLYISNPATPQNSKLLYSKSVERSQNSKSSPQHNIDNSPKQRSQHVQRNLKSTPRQNASLGDFISVDSRGSSRHSAKKTNVRVQSSKNSDGEGSIADRLSITEDSFPEIGKNSGRRQRRINPTKLDTSGGKGTNENSTFGVISRPQTVNPQFVEALPTDKSDTTPFETERDLLRLERQKQQKKLLSNPQIEHTVQLNTSLKTSDIIKLTGPPLAPSLEYVENRQVLDILVKIYSSLFDYNLVLNPMMELNFIMSLITLQHSSENDKYQSIMDCHCSEEKSTTVKLSFEKKSSNESNETLINNHEKFKECLSNELLNEDLGCKVLNDDIVLMADKSVSSSINHKFNDDEKFDNLMISSVNKKNDKCTKECLSTKEPKNIDIMNEEYFQTIHNCIYFSITFLNTQRVLLSLLDRVTLKLLCENNRIATFLPDLQEYISKCYKLKMNKSSRIKQHFDTFSTTEANVSFQIDTDNRENFPTPASFQTFRKQRDLFYEVLRIWEINHLVPGWLFSIALAGKIRTLLSLHNDAANYCHFARLFKSQLLLSCIGNGPQDDPVDDEVFSFLKSFKHLDPKKLTRLRERLVTPLSSKGPVPPPSFTGVQEFYKDFILYASNPMFYAHLQDCLVHEIMELNDTQFTGSEIEDTETMVDEETKQNFITCISSLRLLAKVLGFLVSLPYRCEISSPESVLVTQLELRKQVLPPLNLQFCLQSAIVHGKLALTIPWVVKYLAMLDPVSLRLPYYRTVFEMLCYIYYESKHNSGFDNPLSLQVVILLKFSIGWLFGLCNFPERLYFNCRMSHIHQKLKSVSNFSTSNLQSILAIEIDQTSNLNKSNNPGPCVDSLDIVDERTLYVCCPFLTELKTLLTADHSNLNNSTTVRHITPVSSGFEKPMGSSGTKQLQLQLEEAFFHGQPVSTRKTVDFVSERVASSCVKHICNSVLPRAREKNVLKFQDIISQHTLPNDINKFKSLIATEMHSIVLSSSSEVKMQCEADILGLCESRATQSIGSLLAEDTLPSVKQMCSEIAIRMAMERVNNWIQSHITGGSLFIKDMEMEIDKAYKDKSVSTQFEKRVHNVEAASPTNVIIELRSLIWELLDNKGQSVTIEIVLQSLDNLYESLVERSDLLPGSEKIIGSMSVDFALFLAAHRTDIFVPKVHDKFIRIWRMECLKFLKSESILSRIFSPRNVMLLATPGNTDVWLPLGQLIRKMLQDDVLSIETLSDQCTTLLRYDWPIEILKHLSTCLTEGIEDFKSTDDESERMKLLLEWIAETCNDMEFTCD